MKRQKKGWSWRVADPAVNRDLNLLYEPGNWGDALKGTWALLATTALIEARGLKKLHYLDPFAGAPSYPLVEASRRRLEALPPGGFALAQEPYSARGLLAGTALLVRDAASAARVETELSIFDADPLRLAAWRELRLARILEGPSGEAVLETAARDGSPADLILVDPYDLFDHWQRFVPHAMTLAAHAAVLLYCFNKAPRGPGQNRLYQAFRAALAARPASQAVLIGRLPADATLARAYHELYLIGPRPIVTAARDTLAAATRALARTLADLGAFEEG